MPPSSWFEQREQQVLGLDEAVVVGERQALGVGQGLLELGGQFVDSHRSLLWLRSAGSFESKLPRRSAFKPPCSSLVQSAMPDAFHALEETVTADVTRALAEDVGTGDLTARAGARGQARSNARLLTRQRRDALRHRVVQPHLRGARPRRRDLLALRRRRRDRRRHVAVRDRGQRARACSPPSARRSTSCSCSPAWPRARAQFVKRGRGHAARRSTTPARRCRACASRRSTPCAWAAA